MTAANPILVPTLEELAGEFDRLLAQYRAADAASDAAPDSMALSDAALHSSRVLMDACGAIAQLPAQTFEHVLLKARALDWFAFSAGPPDNCSDRLAYQLVRALLDGVPQ